MQKQKHLVSATAPTTKSTPIPPHEIQIHKSEQPCVTRFELAHLLHVSVRTVDRMIAAGEIRVRRVRGKAVRFLQSDVECYLNGGIATGNGGAR